MFQRHFCRTFFSFEVECSSPGNATKILASKTYFIHGNVEQESLQCRKTNGQSTSEEDSLHSSLQLVCINMTNASILATPAYSPQSEPQLRELNGELTIYCDFQDSEVKVCQEKSVTCFMLYTPVQDSLKRDAITSVSDPTDKEASLASQTVTATSQPATPTAQTAASQNALQLLQITPAGTGIASSVKQTFSSRTTKRWLPSAATISPWNNHTNTTGSKSRRLAAGGIASWAVMLISLVVVLVVITVVFLLFRKVSACSDFVQKSFVCIAKTCEICLQSYVCLFSSFRSFLGAFRWFLNPNYIVKLPKTGLHCNIF